MNTDAVGEGLRWSAWDKGRMTRLDGLRALAIFGVMLHHFGVQPGFWLDWGPVAPTVFFLLSGYFITATLTKMRERGEVGLVPVFRFHLRRFVRLWPVLLVLLAVGIFAGREEAGAGFLWHAFFLTNVQVAVSGEWPGSLSHLWSLAIQQQFYLLWPLVLLLPTRAWPAAFAVTIGLALGFRLACLMVGTGPLFRWMMLPGSLDAFAAGALVCMVFQSGRVAIPKGWGPAIGGLAIVLWFGARGLRHMGEDLGAPIALVDSLEVACAAILLAALVQNPQNAVSRLLGSRPMAWLGKTSYGLFLWHITAVLLLGPVLDSMGLLRGESDLVRAGLFTAASIGLAAASWAGVEQPAANALNRLLTGWTPEKAAPIVPPVALRAD